MYLIRPDPTTYWWDHVFVRPDPMTYRWDDVSVRPDPMRFDVIMSLSDQIL